MTIACKWLELPSVPAYDAGSKHNSGQFLIAASVRHA